MKRFTFLLLGVAALATQANAQNGTLPVPEFKNKVYAVGQDNALTDLESADMQSEMKTGMTTAKINFRTSGKESSIKKSGKAGVKFVVKVEDGIDPESAVELFRFETDKKGRYFLVGSVVMGSVKTPELNKRRLSFTKVQSGVYMITPVEALPEGEYAFVVNRPAVGVGGAANVKGYAFEVAE